MTDPAATAANDLAITAPAQSSPATQSPPTCRLTMPCSQRTSELPIRPGATSTWQSMLGAKPRWTPWCRH